MRVRIGAGFNRVILPRVGKRTIRLGEILSKLEAFYGAQEPNWPTDPYLFLVWWHCGYPASDGTCAKGWAALEREIGVEPRKLIAAAPAKLAKVLRAGGMVPELRAKRLKEIAVRVKDEFGGDLRGALNGPTARARRILKTFPGVGDPGADRILLFAGIAPLAAVPSNCPQVAVRIVRGEESENYVATYREAQQLVAAEISADFEARQRAYLLLKRHGQEICKRTKPKCGECPVSSYCAFFAGD
jgi:endonuclease III